HQRLQWQPCADGDDDQEWQSGADGSEPGNLAALVASEELAGFGARSKHQEKQAKFIDEAEDGALWLRGGAGAEERRRDIRREMTEDAWTQKQTGADFANDAWLAQASENMAENVRGRKKSKKKKCDMTELSSGHG